MWREKKRQRKKEREEKSFAKTTYTFLFTQLSQRVDKDE